VIEELQRRHYGASIQRLEAGQYHFPEATATGIELTAAQFAMILEGIDTSRVRRFKRFSTAPTPPRAT
jgi:transposase